MISKNDLKFFRSLLLKKFRTKEKLFLTEGERVVLEGVNSGFHTEVIIITPVFLEKNESLVTSLIQKKIRVEIANLVDFKKLSDTETPQGIVGVFGIKNWNISTEKFTNEKTILYLENISDPGNLGTLIRTADWFGLKSVLISKNSADVFNPKVIRSSMGSIFHIKLFSEIETKHLSLLQSYNYKFLCADLKGKNIFSFNKSGKIIISLANESTGPSQDLLELSNEIITVPKLGKAESLNVASAGAILLAQLTKNTI